MSSPYLPYLIRDVVTKVNEVFSTRATDPFNVSFEYGLYVDVTKKIYKQDTVADYQLVWLVDNWSVQRGDAGGNYGEANFQLIIAKRTQSSYTSEERTSNIFLPRLFPIYDELINLIYRSTGFWVQSEDKIRHTVEKRSYWGGNQGGTDTKNLFEEYIDAIHIPSMTLILK